jgi:hypothetical protein
MAQQLLDVLRPERPDPALTIQSARRLFDEADALLTEAEKLDANSPDVLQARGQWLNVNARHFEKDTVRAKALAEQARRLLDRAYELREKKD